MTGDTAFIPVQLSEVLLPSELGQLVELAAREKRSPGEVITVAVRQAGDKPDTAVALAVAGGLA